MKGQRWMKTQRKKGKAIPTREKARKETARGKASLGLMQQEKESLTMNLGVSHVMVLAVMRKIVGRSLRHPLLKEGLHRPRALQRQSRILVEQPDTELHESKKQLRATMLVKFPFSTCGSSVPLKILKQMRSG